METGDSSQGVGKVDAPGTASGGLADSAAGEFGASGFETPSGAALKNAPEPLRGVVHGAVSIPRALTDEEISTLPPHQWTPEEIEEITRLGHVAGCTVVLVPPSYAAPRGAAHIGLDFGAEPAFLPLDHLPEGSY